MLRITVWGRPDKMAGPSCYGAGLTYKDWCERVATDLRANGIDAVVSKPNTQGEIAVFRRK
jgi:hypothetical protein